jgi:hypothetical protein
MIDELSIKKRPVGSPKKSIRDEQNQDLDLIMKDFDDKVK